MTSLYPCSPMHVFFFFFFNDTATTEIYTLSLHDALPIWPSQLTSASRWRTRTVISYPRRKAGSHSVSFSDRSEEHTSELQSQSNLVCRLLLEKKNKVKPLLPHAHLQRSTPHVQALSLADA